MARSSPVPPPPTAESPLPEDTEAIPHVPSPTGGGPLTRAAARLSLAHLVVVAGGIVTGPLLAHALGAAGRGHLASIVVPVTLLGWFASFGLGPWVAVECARGRPIGTALGTAGVLALGLGTIGAVGFVPVSIALADGNDTILLFMLIGGALLPFMICLQLLSSAAIGRSEWKMQARHRTVPAIVSLALTAGLFVVGKLTLSAAAVVFLVAGVLSVLPLLPLVRAARPFRFERALARRSLSFGVRAWTSDLGALTNARLDQLLMIPLVPARQLGLYVVAVTYAGLPTVLSAAMMTVIGPRISAGDNALVGRSLRVTVVLMSLAGLFLAILAPIILPLAFGRDFEEAVEIAWILLLASVPLAGTVVLSTAMIAAGRPGTPAVGQITAAVLTLIGLLLLLPSMQAIGAALVSLIAYSTALTFMVIATTRHLETSLWSLLKPQRSDLGWALAILRSARTRGLGSRPRTGGTI